MDLLIGPGQVRCIYAEEIDLAALGELHIQRASHVEPDAAGRWWADLSPVQGPRLGPYSKRSEALAAELQWLKEAFSSLHIRKDNHVRNDHANRNAVSQFDRLLGPEPHPAGPGSENR